MDIKDFKVGQTVYIRLIGNESRGKSGDNLIEEWEIIFVGRKLIKAKKRGLPDWSAVTFEKREQGYGGQFVQKTNYCVDYVLYTNRQSIEEDIERSALLNCISTYFGSFEKKKISLESLRKIAELIKETDI